jgi:hypothetical protein
LGFKNIAGAAVTTEKIRKLPRIGSEIVVFPGLDVSVSAVILDQLGALGPD